ncbi:MAG TPA: hypothetical protein VIF62_27005 [Labilithrix sp.]|jgi:tetratricopeptide (TPR) repeat protein
MSRARTLCLAVVLAGLAPSVAHAQAHDENRATAEDLFQRGNAAMAAGRTREACSLFAESYRIDKAGGTLQNLAYCYETAGMWASAYARYEELLAVSRAAKRADRVLLAEDHLAKVTPRLSRVVVSVDASAHTGVTIAVDGTSYEEAAWSTGIVIDPGHHELVARAPHKKAFTKGFDAVEAQNVQIAIPVLADAPEAKPPPTPPEIEHPTRPLGIIVGGAGLVALATGATFGILAIAANDSGKKACRGDPGTDQFDVNGECYRGSDAWNAANRDKARAETLATVSDVLVPVGAVAAVVGAYLFFHASRSTTERGARIAPSPNGVSIEGAF